MSKSDNYICGSCMRLIPVGERVRIEEPRQPERPSLDDSNALHRCSGRVGDLNDDSLGQAMTDNTPVKYVRCLDRYVAKRRAQG